jgi:transcriptional regulator with XRE-family HTH domain
VPKTEPFPARLRRLRQQRGLTMRGLARAAGLPGRALENYEYGRRQPGLLALRQLAAALGVSLDELAG